MEGQARFFINMLSLEKVTCQSTVANIIQQPIYIITSHHIQTSEKMCAVQDMTPRPAMLYFRDKLACFAILFWLNMDWIGH